jgi:hypothetical protein
MTTKSKAKMTKAELIKAIEHKVARAKPIVKNDLIRGLKSKKKSTLIRYLNNARVDKDGYGIRLG